MGIIQPILTIVISLGRIGAAIWKQAIKIHARRLYGKAYEDYTNASKELKDELERRKELYRSLDTLDKVSRLSQQTNYIELNERSVELREKISGALLYIVRFYPLFSKMTTANALSDLILKQNALQRLFQFEKGNLDSEYTNRVQDRLSKINTHSKLQFTHESEDILYECEYSKKTDKESKEAEIIRILITTAQLPGNFYLWGNFQPLLFDWDDIPEGHKKELFEFNKLSELLENDFGIDWTKNANIHKFDEGKAIDIFRDENSVKITIDEKAERTILKISEQRIHELEVRRENGGIKIYKPPELEAKNWKFPVNKFWIVTPEHIKGGILADEKAYLAFILCVLQRASILSVVPGLSHKATRGCLFDLTWYLQEVRYLIDNNFICEECRSKILSAKAIPEGRRILFLDALDGWIRKTNLS